METEIVATRCIFLGYRGDVRMYAFPGAYKYREFRCSGTLIRQILVSGAWTEIQAGEEKALKEVG